MVHDNDFHILPHLVGESPLIIDVGANKGQSIRSIKTVLPNARIHSFELNPQFHPALEELAATYDDVAIHNLGLGTKPDAVTYYIPSAGGVQYLEEVSMVLAEYEKPWIKDRWAPRGEVVIEEARGIILNGDQFHFSPDIIKIDVEGAESEVVVGFQKTIERYGPILFVENGDWPRLWPIIEPLGYMPFMPDESFSRLVPYTGVRANTFYICDSKACDRASRLTRAQI